MKPFSKSRVSIPLCQLISLPIVRPILAIDVQLLENEFVNGYKEGDRVLYVSSYDKDGNTMDIRDEDTLEEHWQFSNKSFEEILKNDKDYERFCNKMFFVLEGNYQVTAWCCHIDKVHGDDKEWHYSVDCIVLESTGSVIFFLNVMYDVNIFVSCSVFFYIFLVYNYKIIKFIDNFLSSLLGLRNQIMSRQIPASVDLNAYASTGWFISYSRTYYIISQYV
jgi:hypothetical protein